MADQTVTLLTEMRDQLAQIAVLKPHPSPALDPVTGDVLALNTFGQVCTWIALLCMALTTVYAGMKASQSKNNGVEMLTFFITAIATIAYLTMATGHGVMDSGTEQPFYYARYIDWLFTTPLMVWDLMELTNSDAMHIFVVVGLDVLMIVCGIVGCLLIEHGIRWAFFILGCVFFAMVCKELLAGLNRGASAARGVYASATYLTVISWTCYPIVWALCEGSDVVSVNVAALLYCVMDVVAKCVFGIIIVSNRDAIEAVNRARVKGGAVSEATPLKQSDL